MIFRFCLFLLISALSLTAHADPAAPFDLVGPTLEVKVTRGDATLPASSVPNLAEGDKLWIKTDLPATQSANYLMIVAFLSGSTNPPPNSRDHIRLTVTLAVNGFSRSINHRARPNRFMGAPTGIECSDCGTPARTSSP